MIRNYDYKIIIWHIKDISIDHKFQRWEDYQKYYAILESSASAQLIKGDSQPIRLAENVKTSFAVHILEKYFFLIFDFLLCS